MKTTNSTMRTIFLLLVAPLLFGACSQNNDNTPESAIRTAMQKQEQAWNVGDIHTFMETYWNHDSLLFVGGAGPVYGWRNTLNRYLKTYPDTMAMGKLHFNILKTKPLSSNHYFVLGQWHLTRSIGDASGHFTLIFEKIDGEWLIISDHSS